MNAALRPTARKPMKASSLVLGRTYFRLTFADRDLT
jgi:hypothetical protein